jgi:hypothetical protein
MEGRRERMRIRINTERVRKRMRIAACIASGNITCADCRRAWECAFVIGFRWRKDATKCLFNPSRFSWDTR